MTSSVRGRKQPELWGAALRFWAQQTNWMVTHPTPMSSHSFHSCPLPAFIHGNTIASTGIFRDLQLFPSTFSYLYSQIYYFNGLRVRVFHHVEIAQFPSVAKGPHSAFLVYPRLIWLWAFIFCKGWAEQGKRAFRWRVLEKGGLKSQQSLGNCTACRNCRCVEKNLSASPAFLHSAMHSCETGQQSRAEATSKLWR